MTDRIEEVKNDVTKLFGKIKTLMATDLSDTENNDLIRILANVEVLAGMDRNSLSRKSYLKLAEDDGKENK